LLAGELGDEWTELVGSWWKLEEGYGFATSPKSHPTANRPKEVGAWVKNARKGKPALTGGVEGLKEQWDIWWRGINPEWRIREGELVQEGSGSWEVLRCPGQNGFLNVLMSLKWWHDGTSEEWRRAAGDVKWVLE
ncbi:hypothetical protein B0H16DRAFT_1246912, partial [Mycena metata]